MQAPPVPLPEILHAVRQELLEPWAALRVHDVQQHTATALPAKAGMLSSQSSPGASTASSEAAAAAAASASQPEMPRHPSAAGQISMPSMLTDAVKVTTGPTPAVGTSPAADANAESRLHAMLQQAAQPASGSKAKELKSQTLLGDAAAPEGISEAAGPMALSMALLQAAEDATQDLQWENGSQLADEVAELPDSMSEAALSMASQSTRHVQGADSLSTDAKGQQGGSKPAQEVAALPDSMSEATTATADEGMSISGSEATLPDHHLSASAKMNSTSANQHAEEVAERSEEQTGAEAHMSSTALDQVYTVLVGASSPAKLQSDRLDSSSVTEQVAALPDQTMAAEISTANQSISPAQVNVFSPASVSNQLLDNSTLVDETAQLPDSIPDTPTFSVDEVVSSGRAEEMMFMGTQASALLQTEMQSSSNAAEEVALLPDGVAEAASHPGSQAVSPEKAEGVFSMSAQPSKLLDRDAQSSSSLAEEVANLPESMTDLPPVGPCVSTNAAAEVLQSSQPSAVFDLHTQGSRTLAEEVAHLPDSMTVAPASQHIPVGSAAIPNAQHSGEEHSESMVSKDSHVSDASPVALPAVAQQQSNQSLDRLRHALPVANHDVAPELLNQQAASTQLPESSVADSLDSLHPEDWRSRWSDLQHQQQQCRQQPWQPPKPKPQQPSDLMIKIAAVAAAQPAHMQSKASVTGQVRADLKEAMLAAAAEYRATVSRLQPGADAATCGTVQQQTTSFAHEASPTAASAFADSLLPSADPELDQVRPKMSSFCLQVACCIWCCIWTCWQNVRKLLSF